MRAKCLLPLIATAGVLMATAGSGPYAQSADPNTAPNPYEMQDSWAQLTGGRKFGQAIKIQVDHSDGKSIWVFERCGSNECTNSKIPPLIKFSPSGTFVGDVGTAEIDAPSLHDALRHLNLPSMVLGYYTAGLI